MKERKAVLEWKRLMSAEFTLEGVVTIIWLERLKVIFFGIAAALVGVVYALLAPVEYTSEVKIMPELQGRSAMNFKRFGALAEIAGIDLSGMGNTEAIRPDLYPDVLKSTPFVIYLLNQPVVTVKKQRFSTLGSYLTSPKEGWLTGLLAKEPLAMPPPAAEGTRLRLSPEQEDVVKDVRERVLSDLDKQSGIIVVRVKMPDAEVAAQVSQIAINYLTHYVIDYRTQKARQDLAFLERRQREARRRYEQALLNLTTHKDGHRYLVTQVAGIEERKLQAELDLSQALLSNLTRDYEQVRLKVQEETPILKVLEPPLVPTKRSAPKRTMLVLLFGTIGGLIGISWVLFKNVNQNRYIKEHDDSTRALVH